MPLLVLGNIITDRITTNEVVERADVKGDTLTGTPNVNLADNALFNYTGNSSGNFTFNFRGDNSTALIICWQLMSV